MSEAVEQVRNTLGSDAVIIDTLRGTDHIGRFVEITATGELKAPAESQPYPPPATPQPPASSPRARQLTQRGGANLHPPRSGTRRSPAPRGAVSRPSVGRSREVEIPSPSQAQPSPYAQSGGRPSARRPIAQFPGQEANHLQPQSQPHNGINGSYAAPVKGAERYVHPNTFSTPRDVIIPQPAPLPSSTAHYNSHRSNRNASGEPGAFNRPQTNPQRAQKEQHNGARPGGHTLREHSAPQREPHQAGASLSPPLSRATQPKPSRNAPINGAAPVPNASTNANPLQTSLSAMQGALTPRGPEAVQFVTERLNEIVSYIQSGQNTGGMPAPVFDHLRQFNRQLQATGIDARFADQLIEETKARIRLNQLDKQVILAHLGQVLAQNIICIDPFKFDQGHKNILAFVGPTGVGKTTTIAKIAAHAHLTHEMPVTLISTDTFRMAAVEQLSRYAEILDCPAEAADTPETLWKLVDAATTPLVLVDTTGRNPKTQGQLKVLSEFFDRGWNGRTVLTVAANTREQDLKPIVEGFSPLKYDMIAVTKLDETYALGTIYNAFKYTGCPIAWTTNGQRVPEDIELANAETIAVKIIMEAISHKI
jgi:flagellar biosynthesis protein FlhF